MIEVSPSDVLRFLLRIGVFLLLGPLVAGIGYEAWLLWSSSFFPRSPFELLAKFVFVIFCAYALGWKVALVAGLVMAPFCALIRSYAASLVASAVIGGTAGAWLVGLGFWITHTKPEWHHAGFGAFASLFSMWVIYHDRYLRPATKLADRPIDIDGTPEMDEP